MLCFFGHSQVLCKRCGLLWVLWLCDCCGLWLGLWVMARGWWHNVEGVCGIMKLQPTNRAFVVSRVKGARGCLAH